MKNDQDNIKLKFVTKAGETGELDRILWEVLWKPFDLPRNIRNSFKLETESIELVAKQGSVIMGGLVANFLSAEEVELRHIAIEPTFRNRSVGTMLVRKLVEAAKRRGCLVIQVYARNTSISFFSKLGFAPLKGKILEHPDFSKHGIAFQQMQYAIKS